jgi:hypothetical protein
MDRRRGRRRDVGGRSELRAGWRRRRGRGRRRRRRCSRGRDGDEEEEGGREVQLEGPGGPGEDEQEGGFPSGPGQPAEVPATFTFFGVTWALVRDRHFVKFGSRR